MNAQALTTDMPMIWHDSLWDRTDAGERRGQTRARTILAYGKLRFSGFEQICQVRDISPRGISVEARRLPQPGQRVWIEMRGLAPAPAIVMWCEGKRGGLAFETEQDLGAIFAARDSGEAITPRSPRFSLKLPAELRWYDAAARLEVVDISMGGAKLSGRTTLDVGARGKLRLDGLPEEISGHIRWKEDDYLGFRFDHPMQRDDLFTMLSCRS